MLPRKTPFRISRPSPACTINHSYAPVRACPARRQLHLHHRDHLSHPVEGGRGSWFASLPDAGWVGIQLLLRDRREILACQEHQAFLDLAKASVPRDQGGCPWTSSSTSPARAGEVETSRVLVVSLRSGISGLGLEETHGSGLEW